jgi:hypothetical protein
MLELSLRLPVLLLLRVGGPSRLNTQALPTLLGPSVRADLNHCAQQIMYLPPFT